MNKKKLAGKLLKVSPKKVKFVAGALEDIKKAITRSDLRGLIAVKKVIKSRGSEHSRSRARHIIRQKRKGRQKGPGSRKGSKYSVVARKQAWMALIRTQRRLLQDLKQKQLLSAKDYKLLYAKCKGGYFRSRRHIKLFISEHKLIQENKTKENK